jgi:hypothetical protein
MGMSDDSSQQFCAISIWKVDSPLWILSGFHRGNVQKNAPKNLQKKCASRDSLEIPYRFHRENAKKMIEKSAGGGSGMNSFDYDYRFFFARGYGPAVGQASCTAFLVGQFLWAPHQRALKTRQAPFLVGLFAGRTGGMNAVLCWTVVERGPVGSIEVAFTN